MANENNTENKAAMAENKAAATAPEVKDEIVVTEHEMVVGGQVLHYTATTGLMVMKDEEGKAKAKIFFIAYTKKDVTDSATRPSPSLSMAGRVPRRSGYISACLAPNGC
jgi:carboxypeptidase C (cathepsin A)